MDIEFGIKFFSALFAIMNPFVVLPIFLSMTSGMPIAKQKKTAIQTVFYSAIMCLIISLAGQQIIGFFGITIDQFRTAGGIILFGIALSMLNGNDNKSHEGSENEKKEMSESNSISFYPMAFPMIVGPGTIATLIIFSHQATGVTHDIAYGLAVLAVIVLMFLVLFFSSSIGKLLSSQMRVIITRLMGMILAAISVEMITDGLLVILPGLGVAH